MFDRLMLLAKGKVIYFNEAKYAVDYFASINYRCPELSNPADYFMSIMSIESIEKTDTEDQDELQRSVREVNNVYAQRIDEFSESYKKSKLRNDPDLVDPNIVPLKVDDEQLKQGSY